MSRRVILIGATLLLAVLGTGSVLLYVGRADARALAGKQAVTVLLAAKKVTAGTSAGDAERTGLLRASVMPAETVPADAVTVVTDDLSALVAGGDIQPGQLLLRPMFVATQPRSGGLPIPDRKIAVSVSTTGAQRAAGFIQPGSTVAVFDSFNVLDGKGRTPAGDGLQKQHDYNQATRLVVTGVEVLAVGPPTAGSEGVDVAEAGAGLASKSGAGGDVVLVTLALTQAEAEKVIHVAQTGSVYLALLTDQSVTAPGTGVDNRTVFGD